MAQSKGPWYLAPGVPFVTSFGSLALFFGLRAFIFHLIVTIDPTIARVFVFIWLALPFASVLGAWSGFKRSSKTKDGLSLFGGILNAIYFSRSSSAFGADF